MVDYWSLISSSKCHDIDKNMSSSFLSTDQSTQMKQSPQSQRHKKQTSHLSYLLMPPCKGSSSAALDIVLVIAVLGACGFLVYPCVKLVCHAIAEIGGLTFTAVRSEVCEAPFVYAFLGFSVATAILAVWGILHHSTRKCDNPNCRGLHKAGEFDIQVETEESIRNYNSRSDSDLGLFKLAENHHKELEAELKKMAPPNGRVVLVFRARCGCSVGRMEVWGPKKIKKIKK